MKEEKKISITVQDSDRLGAISDLAVAIKEVALSLNAVPIVNISGNTFNETITGPAINVDLKKDVSKTEIIVEDE